VVRKIDSTQSPINVLRDILEVLASRIAHDTSFTKSPVARRTPGKSHR